MSFLTALQTEITGNVATIGYLLGALAILAVAVTLVLLYRVLRRRRRDSES